MKSEDFNSKFNRLSFFDTLIQNSIRTMKRGPESLYRLYEGYKKLIENQIRSTPENEEECRELLEILEKTYRMLSDPEVADIIIKNNVTHKQFISKYGEKILGDNKRKYDMSDRFNPSLIAYQDREIDARKVKYIPEEGIEHIYLDEEGKEVSIQEIGKLYFEEWNGVKSSVSKYRVIKQLAEGAHQTSEVFSNIKIIEMEDPEYREAVLGELLSKNNIELSKTGGYVGEITDVPTSERLKVGGEKIIAGDYFYRVNPQYMITYHSEEIAAAMLLEQAQNSKSKEKTKNERIIKMPIKGKIGQNVESHHDPDKSGRKLGGDPR